MIIAMCSSLSGCHRQSAADIAGIEESYQDSIKNTTQRSKENQETKTSKTEGKSYKLAKDQVVGDINRLLSAKLCSKYDVVNADGNQYSVRIKNVQVGDDLSSLPTEQQEFFSTAKNGELLECCNNSDKMFVFVSVEFTSLTKDSHTLGVNNLRLYNIYPDSNNKYNYFYPVTSDFNAVYGSDYTGTDFDGFIVLQPGQVKSVVIAYYNIYKHQLKYSNKNTGETQFYDECKLENTYMKTDIKSGQIVSGESMLYLGIKNNQVEE